MLPRGGTWRLGVRIFRACVKVGRASWLLVRFSCCGAGKQWKIENVFIWVQFVVLECLGYDGAAMEARFLSPGSQRRILHDCSDALSEPQPGPSLSSTVSYHII